MHRNYLSAFIYALTFTLTVSGYSQLAYSASGGGKVTLKPEKEYRTTMSFDVKVPKKESGNVVYWFVVGANAKGPVTLMATTKNNNAHIATATFNEQGGNQVKYAKAGVQHFHPYQPPASIKIVVHARVHEKPKAGKPFSASAKVSLIQKPANWQPPAEAKPKPKVPVKPRLPKPPYRPTKPKK